MTKVLYTLTAPIFAGSPLSPKDLREAASINGYPAPTRTNSRDDFSIGPIEVADDDEVIILYAGNNISDEPNLALHQDFDKTLTKAVSAFYLALLGGAAGELVSTLGLGGAIQFIKGILPGDVDKFLSDPVGFALGVGKSGPCNGFVYKDAVKKSGRAISLLAYELVSTGKYGSIDKATLKKSYSDSDYGHDTDACGDVAHTDVTIEITRYEKVPLGQVLAFQRPYGIREKFRAHSKSVTVKQLCGLRN